MKRRNFTLIAAAGVTAIGIPGLYYYLSGIEYDPLLAQPVSLAPIWDNETIHSMGMMYRSQHPSEKNERKLAKKLLAETAGKNGEITDIIHQSIRKDFETGNTVMLDGWILSATEARQCGLFSIVQPG